MSEADADRREDDRCEEVSSELVVARGDSAQMFEFVEEALDEVALAVAFRIDGANDTHVALAWDMGGCSHHGEQLDDRARTVAAVGDRLAGRAQAVDQAGQGGFVGSLTGGQQQPNRQTHGIDDRVDFGGPPRERPMA